MTGVVSLLFLFALFLNFLNDIMYGISFFFSVFFFLLLPIRAGIKLRINVPLKYLINNN